MAQTITQIKIQIVFLLLEPFGNVFVSSLLWQKKKHFSVFFPLFFLLSWNVLSGGETPDPKMAHHCNWEKRVGFCFFASDFLELMSCVSPLSSGQRCFLGRFSCLH